MTNVATNADADADSNASPAAALSIVVAAIQTNSSDDVDANLTQAAKYIKKAKTKGAELVALPECFALMPKYPAQLNQHAEAHGDGKIQNFLAQLSGDIGIWIVAGSLPLRGDEQRTFNSLLVYNAQGKNVARYDKIHLFDAELPRGEHYRESEYTMPGSECVLQDTPAGIMGLTICYDLRFPEIYRKLSAMGASCVVVPSAFTVPTGKAHWLSLLRARAIENSCYIIAPAQVGKHANGRKTYGHSLIIDPWGEIIAQRKTKPGIAVAKIESEKLARVKLQLPSLTHRRADLFPN